MEKQMQSLLRTQVFELFLWHFVHYFLEDVCFFFFQRRINVKNYATEESHARRFNRGRRASL